jgi:hypothetical protein
LMPASREAGTIVLSATALNARSRDGRAAVP